MKFNKIFTDYHEKSILFPSHAVLHLCTEDIVGDGDWWQILGSTSGGGHYAYEVDAFSKYN